MVKLIWLICVTGIILGLFHLKFKNQCLLRVWDTHHQILKVFWIPHPMVYTYFYPKFRFQFVVGALGVRALPERVWIGVHSAAGKQCAWSELSNNYRATKSFQALFEILEKYLNFSENSLKILWLSKTKLSACNPWILALLSSMSQGTYKVSWFQ